MGQPNTQHTPGPWRVGYSDGSGPACIVRDCGPETNGPGLVATIGYHGDPELRGQMTPEECANAALIAHAPDMAARIAALESELAASRSHVATLREALGRLAAIDFPAGSVAEDDALAARAALAATEPEGGAR